MRWTFSKVNSRIPDVSLLFESIPESRFVFFFFSPPPDALWTPLAAPRDARKASVSGTVVARLTARLVAQLTAARTGWESQASSSSGTSHILGVQSLESGELVGGYFIFYLAIL